MAVPYYSYVNRVRQTGHVPRSAPPDLSVYVAADSAQQALTMAAAWDADTDADSSGYEVLTLEYVEVEND